MAQALGVWAASIVVGIVAVAVVVVVVGRRDGAALAVVTGLVFAAGAATEGQQ